jgi:hypothetical protein
VHRFPISAAGELVRRRLGYGNEGGRELGAHVRVARLQEVTSGGCLLWIVIGVSLKVLDVVGVIDRWPGLNR